MSQYRYTFEKGSKKHQCPACHKKRFVKYIDVQTKEYLPEIYGKCDREMNCGYHLNPYKNGYAKDNTIKNEFNYQINRPKVKPKRVCIPKDVFYKTRKAYEENTFIQNLLNNIAFPFESEDIEKIIAQYHLGTVTKGYCKGGTTFPFIDINNNIRAIQVKTFNKSNHTKNTNFLHSIITKHHTQNQRKIPNWLKDYNNNETKVSCLFGEHLLSKYPYNPIALVEAPKTAIYGTLYFGFPNNPKNLLWLAVYNLSSLNINKCKALKGRNVYLFPDLSKEGKAFNLWSSKAQKIQQQIEDSFFKVSDLLEELAPNQDKEEGKDIADYLIKLDWHKFRKEKNKNSLQEAPKKVTEQTKIIEEDSNSTNSKKAISQSKEIQPKTTKIQLEENLIFQEKQTDNWNEEIDELESFFNKINIPKNNCLLNQATKITNVTQFLKSHLAIVKANNGKPIYLPYLRRLQELKHILSD
ncbi:DUF6965 family protein [Polaribacter sargassicola]|uniref:DUF6965 family protein n=1 Tax=Polaribacter sargassicola TaxID=2836891 RepID=UPI001F2D5156|nr:DUF6371 domain-containing protein [Polaribacter sp. DS7-9]MCG1037299.1 hypothetical protein [Polaribacter sp. DS7-9]